MRLRPSSSLLFFFLTTFALASTIQPVSVPGLGAASFPTTTRSPQAQAAFLRGLLLLHVFEYASAARSFAAAEAADPSFSMAYWGEAMTANHPVWNQLDQPAGQKALSKFAATPAARAARVPDARERGYLAAVEILFDPTGTKVERDARYADAMHSLSSAYPDDDEARLFYSLALLGKSEGRRDVPVYLEAAGLAREVFARNPQHPGAAHYWIHGMDDPQHAAGALPAAMALSRIAPDAGHAQHMCSHIFMALGMWNEVVHANEEAMRVVAEQNRADGDTPVLCFHYAQWLEYGYFQQGRRSKAEEMVTACQASAQAAVAAIQQGHAAPVAQAGPTTTAEGLKKRAAASLLEMRDMAVVESQDWNGPAARMSFNPGALGEGGGRYAFTNGLVAAMRGDTPAAEAALRQLQTVAETTDAAHPREPQEAAYLLVLKDELAGALDGRAGHMDQAVTRARQAAALYEGQPFDFGPPAVIKPPEELLGELLLAKADGPGAVQAFHASLRLAPHRTLSVAGLARAQALAGNLAASRATWAQLLSIWSEADANLPQLAEARVGATAVRRNPLLGPLDARLQDVHRACREQGDSSERDHGLYHHDQLGPAGENGNVCW